MVIKKLLNVLMAKIIFFWDIYQSFKPVMNPPDPVSAYSLIIVKCVRVDNKLVLKVKKIDFEPCAKIACHCSC